MMNLELPESLLTERLALRRLRYEDAEEIFYTYASKPEATRYVSWLRHRKVEDTRNFIEYAIQGWKERKDFTYGIRLREANRLIGSIGVMNDLGKIQFGYIFSPTQWNKGFATEACRSILDLLRQQPGIIRIGTLVDAENLPSIKVLRKCGLMEEGTIRELMKFPNQDGKSKDCVLFNFPL
jgi:[ribosomal protein S5]-alanine N-acetyltransferase